MNCIVTSFSYDRIAFGTPLYINICLYMYIIYIYIYMYMYIIYIYIYFFFGFGGRAESCMMVRARVTYVLNHSSRQVSSSCAGSIFSVQVDHVVTVLKSCVHVL